ncbi:low choriolytic enzyme-like [Clytia hemisphaerica]
MLHLNIWVILIVSNALVNCEWNQLMESSEYFEGDIELNATQQAILNAPAGSGYALTKRGIYTHWPFNKPIAYHIDDVYEKSQYHRVKLENALKDYEAQTCLRFVKRTNERQYINFGSGRGCSSMVGMQANGNFIRLARGCFSHGTLLHEIAHSLGIWHEQNRPDRDLYIKVRPENMACCSYQFRKMHASHIDSLGFPYDLESMMHYSSRAFGNGKGPTIEPLDKTKSIGQRRGFSRIDVMQINAMYCKDSPNTPPPTDPPTQPSTAPTSAPQGKVLKHASSNMCLALDRNNELIFSSNCQTRFKISEGKFWHPKGWLCAEPLSRQSESPIRFKVNCKEGFSKVNQGGRNFVIRHKGTGKCIHPNRGSSNPSEGTKAIIFHQCNAGSRIQFVEA